MRAGIGIPGCQEVGNDGVITDPSGSYRITDVQNVEASTGLATSYGQKREIARHSYRLSIAIGIVSACKNGA
jgi:hypothetical protein